MKIFRVLLLLCLLMTSSCMTAKVLDKAGYYNERATTEPNKEETVRRSPGYYALLPLSIPADIATSPFQLIPIAIFSYWQYQ